MRKLFSLLYISIICFSFQTLTAQDADAAWVSIHRLTTGISMDFGNFKLEGNEGGYELIGGKREDNRAEANSIGLGIAFNYRLIDGLDAFYATRYDWANEPLVEAYGLVFNDFGARYQVPGMGNFFPFAKLSYTWYTIQDLKVVDETLIGHSATYVREYDWQGKGLTFGFGIELKMGEHLYYTADYNILKTMGNLEKLEGGVDFENNPKINRFSFAFRFVI